MAVDPQFNQFGALSANMRTGPETDGVHSAIIRRIRELEALKAQLSQLEAQEHMALARTVPWLSSKSNLRMPPSSVFVHLLTTQALSAQTAIPMSTSGACGARLRGAQLLSSSLEEARLSSAFQQLGCSTLSTSGLGAQYASAPGLEHLAGAPSLQSSVAARAAGLESPQSQANISVPAVSAAPFHAEPPPQARREAFETPAEFAVQKAINKELLAASAAEDEQSAFQALTFVEAPAAQQLRLSARLQVLAVASKHLEQMNGVNLSTAIHRIARACQRFKQVADEIKKALGSDDRGMRIAGEYSTGRDGERSGKL